MGSCIYGALLRIRLAVEDHDNYSADETVFYIFRKGD